MKDVYKRNSFLLVCELVSVFASHTFIFCKPKTAHYNAYKNKTHDCSSRNMVQMYSPKVCVLVTWSTQWQYLEVVGPLESEGGRDMAHQLSVLIPLPGDQNSNHSTHYQAALNHL